ncbi:MAG: hypothetical protein SF123_09590 [Chloroflexota bacterium]|nr:hypothetical protein [Chloroflexota bacterium]
MANNVTLVQPGQGRFFMQPGTKPSAAPEYYGQLGLGDTSVPLGELTPFYAPSSERANTWDIVDMAEGEPGLVSTELTARLDRDGRDIWFDWAMSRVATNGYALLFDKCKRVDAFDEWASAIIYKDLRPTELTIPAISPLEPGDNGTPLAYTIPLQARVLMRVRTLQFEPQAAALIEGEIVAGLIDDTGCDSRDFQNRAKKIYMLAKPNPGTPGTNPLLVYTNDGQTWQTDVINSLAGNAGVAMAMMGDRFIIVSTVDNAHHHTKKSAVDDGNSTWTRVGGTGSGYVSSKAPTDIYVMNSAQAFLCGQGGYIYLMTNPTRPVTPIVDGALTVQNLNAIHGHGHTIVAVGASNAVLVSGNDGDTFALVVGPAAGVSLKSVCCISDDVWLIGTANGKLFATENRGKRWSDITPDSDIAAVNSIRFERNGMVGYMAVTTSGGAGRTYRTITAGHIWSSEPPYLMNEPTSEAANVVIPFGANQIVVGGKVSSTDGIISIAS